MKLSFQENRALMPKPSEMEFEAFFQKKNWAGLMPMPSGKRPRFSAEDAGVMHNPCKKLWCERNVVGEPIY